MLKKTLCILIIAMVTLSGTVLVSAAEEEQNVLSSSTVKEFEAVESVEDFGEAIDIVYEEYDVNTRNIISGTASAEELLLPDNICNEIVDAVQDEVLNEIIEEKTDDAIKAINNNADEIEMLEVSPNNYVGNIVIDLGDNCFVEIEVEDFEEPSILTSVLDYVCQPSYATSKSGSKVVWKEYGKRYYTAKAKLYYGVAYGMFALENHYTLSGNGVSERYGIAYGEDSGLIKVSEGTPTITTAKATKIGNSACITCTFKATKGYSPIEWTKSYKMKARVKYLDKDATNKEIKVNQNWDFNSL